MRHDRIIAVLDSLGLSPNRWKSQGWIEAKCPYAAWTHLKGTDNRPSFSVKCEEGEENIYTCLSCKAYGRIQYLARDLQGYPHDAKTSIMLRDLNLKLQADEDIPAPFAYVPPPPPQPLDPMIFEGIYPAVETAPSAMAYLAGRGVSLSTARRLGLLYDPQQRRVLFPVWDREGLLWGFTGRLIADDTSPMNPKIRDYSGLRKSSVILGSEAWDRGLPVLIVEGLFGYAHLMEEGVPAICNVGCVMGSHLSQAQASIIAQFGMATYLAFDPDAAGHAGLWGTGGKSKGAVHMIGNLAHVPEWPRGKIDPDQLSYDDVSRWLDDTVPEVCKIRD